jgi:integrase
LSGHVFYCLCKSVGIGYLKAISGFNWNPEKDISGQVRMKLEAKQRQSMAPKASGKRKRSAYPKSDLRYWQDVVYKPRYRDGLESNNYVVRIGFAGRRTTFALATSNETAAASRAKEIYTYILANGWNAALAKFKIGVQKSSALTVGQFLSEAQKYLDVRPRTFGDCARAFRKIVSNIFNLDPGNSKFDYQRGGHNEWIAKVDAVKLCRITPEKVREWSSAYVDKSNGDLAKKRSARISANTFIRNAKSLFGKAVLEHVQLDGIERLPFDGITTGQRLSMRYRSQIDDIEALVELASRDLATEENREVFKAFLLATLAGLRRNEIDKLRWASFNFDKGFIRIETTQHFAAKTEDSYADIPLDPEMTALFRGFRAQGNGSFVIESSVAPKHDPGYSHYRCDRIFQRLIRWLREKGVQGKNPIHILRKEFGSEVARKFGIFAASSLLRHSDISVTREHYIDSKNRVSVGLGHLLNRPDNVVEIKQDLAGKAR